MTKQSESPTFVATYRPLMERVRAAGEMARAIQHGMFSGDGDGTVRKGDASPVTVADFAVQAVVNLALAEIDPDTPIVAEEDSSLLRGGSAEVGGEVAAELRRHVVAAVASVVGDISEEDVLSAIDRGNHDATAGTYWAFDPIDGTKGFVRGGATKGQYCIALGRIESGKVAFGVLGCPNLPVSSPTAGEGDSSRDERTAGNAAGVILAAAREQGCWQWPMTEKGLPAAPAQVLRDAADSDESWPAKSAIRVCGSLEPSHTNREAMMAVLGALDLPHTDVLIDSQCKYALVARDDADVYLRMPTRKRYIEKVWDHAAGQIVAEEAGAIVTDIFGRPFDYSHGVDLNENSGILCTVPALHGRFLGTIRGLQV